MLVYNIIEINSSVSWKGVNRDLQRAGAPPPGMAGPWPPAHCPLHSLAPRVHTATQQVLGPSPEPPLTLSSSLAPSHSRSKQPPSLNSVGYRVETGTEELAFPAGVSNCPH